MDGRRYTHRRAKLLAAVLSEECTCWLCGKPVDAGLRGVRVTNPVTGKHPLHPLSPVLDEIVPVSRGGSALDRGNVRLAHHWCNDYRQARMDIERVQAELRRDASVGAVSQRASVCARTAYVESSDGW